MPKDSYASGPSSNPSSKSYSGGGGGGVSSGKTTSGSYGGGNKGGGLGISTGKTIYGNTAYGPSGGMAQGYATRSGGISGMGPSVGTYSNFRNLDGSAAIPGAGNMTAMGRNAFQARSQLQRMFAPRAPRVGGLLSGEEVETGPIQPRSITPVGYVPPQLQLSIPPAPSYLPETSIRPRPYTPPASAAYSYGWRNPTQRPYDVNTSPYWRSEIHTLDGYNNSTAPKNNLPWNRGS